MDELALAVITEIRQRMAGFPAQLRTALAALDDTEVWSRANPASNSVGNLVLHLCGSTRHFLGRAVGGSDYERNRPAEFAERGPIPRGQLEGILQDTVREAERILAELDASRLLETSERAGQPFTVLALLLRTSHHWAVHTGQIVFAVKASKPGAFEELWMKTMERR